MPSLPGAGLLLYRLVEPRDRGGPAGEAEPPVEVLLFPRVGAAGAAAGTERTLAIPFWELESAEPARPVSRAGLPFELRGLEKPRLTAARTMDALLEQARRSFSALTGLEPDGPFVPLGGVKMRRHRIIYVWACRGEAAPACPGRFVPLDEARTSIEAQQRRFLDQLAGLVAVHK